MIAKLTGVVDSTGDGWAVIDVSGVGYRVFCSAPTLGRLRTGEAASLLIETHMREDHIHLYGFIDASECDWFRLLTTVQGVGAKVGLAILSALGADDLARALVSGDRAAVTRANGVGAKLATRILSELKDKVGDSFLPFATFDPARSGVGIPLWPPVLLSLLVLYVRSHKHRQMRACDACGYSLRGLTSETCPECGRPAIAQHATGS